MRPAASLSSTVFVLVACLLGASSTVAKPLNLTLSTCENASGKHGNDTFLKFTEGWAQLVDNVDQVLGPGGQTGNKLLRMNLVGMTESAIEGFDNTTNKLATLFTSTSVLSTATVSSVSSLCYALNTNPPTALPEENPTSCTIPAGDVALNLTLPLHGSFPLTTLHTTIRIVDTAYPNPNELSCLTISVTPYYPHGWYYKLILYLPVGLAAAYWVVLWTARMMASWGAAVASDVGAVADVHAHGHRGKRKSSKTERIWSRVFGTAVMSSISGDLLVSSPSLLRFVTPGFRDIIWHIQFVSALSQIAVDWPLFVYPITSRGAWASLIGNVTLVQGSNADDKRLSLLDTHNVYRPPSKFASQFNDSSSPLYLDPNAANRFLNMNASKGMESWANAVGLRGEDLFGTSASIFLFICAALILLSLVIWTLHGVVEYGTQKQAAEAPGVVTPPLSPGMFGAPLRNLDAEPSTPIETGSAKDRRQPQVVTLPGDHAPGRLKRQWWKFGLKGSIGVFYASSLQGNLIRLLLLFHMPLTSFAAYHFYLSATTSRCTVASIVLAALFFLVVCVLAPAYLVWRLVTVPSSKLYDATRTLMALGPLYNLYGEGQQRYAAVLLAASLVTGIVVGAGQNSGTAQAAILIVLEIAMGLVTMIWLPWGEGASMGATTFIMGVFRTITLVLVLVLTPAVNIGIAPSAWIAYAILVIQAIILFFYFLVLLCKLVEGIVRLIVDAPFDESTDEFDTGLLGAFSKASCCGEGLLRSSGRRRKRRRGKGAAGRNKRHSTTASQVGMLDVSQTSIGKSPGDPYGPYDGTPGGYDQMGYFPQPDGNFNQPADRGFIMGGWRAPPSGPGPYGDPNYLAMQQHQPQQMLGQQQQPLQDGAPTRSFSKVRGGKAAYESPYTVQPPIDSSGNRSPGPNQPLLFAGDGPSGSQGSQQHPQAAAALAPFPSTSSTPHPAVPPNTRPTGHVRKKSETAVVDFANPPPHFYRHPSGSSMPSFSQAAYATGAGVAPAPRRQQLTAAFGRDDELSDDDDDESDDSTKERPVRRSWFLRNSSKGDYSDSEDSVANGEASGGQSGSRWPFIKRSRPSTDSARKASTVESAPQLPTAADPPTAGPSTPPAPRSFSVVRPNRPGQSTAPRGPNSSQDSSTSYPSPPPIPTDPPLQPPTGPNRPPKSPARSSPKLPSAPLA